MSTEQDNTAAQSPTAGKLVKTCRSGDVILNLFMRQGDYGPYLEPSRPVYRYKTADDELRYSEFLRDRHCLHASFCFQMAHAYIQAWKSRTADELEQKRTASPAIEQAA